MEGITPEAKVTWTDLYKPDKYGYYTISIAFEPTRNEEHKKFLEEIKGMCAQGLTDPDAKKPYWLRKNKDGTPSDHIYCIRFSTKNEIREWLNKDDKVIEQPKRVDTDTVIQIKYKAEVSNNKKFLNLYLNGVKIVLIPNAAPPESKEYEDVDDVPF